MKIPVDCQLGYIYTELTTFAYQKSLLKVNGEKDCKATREASLQSGSVKDSEIT